MNKQSLWQYFVSKNPLFNKGDNETVSISIKNLRKLSDISFEEGKKEGFEGGIKAKTEADKLKPKNEFDGLFDNIFGKKSGL